MHTKHGHFSTGGSWLEGREDSRWTGLSRTTLEIKQNGTSLSHRASSQTPTPGVASGSSSSRVSSVRLDRPGTNLPGGPPAGPSLGPPAPGLSWFLHRLNSNQSVEVSADPDTQAAFGTPGEGQRVRGDSLDHAVASAGLSTLGLRLGWGCMESRQMFPQQVPLPLRV